MNYKQINELWNSMTNAIEKCERFYKLDGSDDGRYVHVRIDLREKHRWAKGERVGAVPHFHVTDTKDRHYYGVDLLTPKELVQIAEYRALVDNWAKGEIDELPPSNFTLPARPE